ncbi:MAG: hypothetical protein AAFR28_03635 [Pseudomonadota bacterium]
MTPEQQIASAERSGQITKEKASELRLKLEGKARNIRGFSQMDPKKQDFVRRYQELRPKADAAEIEANYAPELAEGGFKNEVVQGLTLGFGDEIGAGVSAGLLGVPHALYGAVTGQDVPSVREHYDRVLAHRRAAADDYRRRAPYTSMGAGVVGGVIGGLGTVGGIRAAAGAAGGGSALRKLGIEAAKAFPKQATTRGGLIAQGTALGAYGGGVTGFGEGSGGFSNRLDRAIATAPYGAALGGGLGAAAAYAGPAIGAISDQFNAPRRGDRRVAEAVVEGGNTFDDIRAMDADGVRTVADLNENTRALAGSASRLGDVGRQTMTEFAQARQAGRLTRMRDSFAEGIGAPADVRGADARVNKAVRVRRDEAERLINDFARDRGYSRGEGLNISDEPMPRGLLNPRDNRPQGWTWRQEAEEALKGLPSSERARADMIEQAWTNQDGSLSRIPTGDNFDALSDDMVRQYLRSRGYATSQHYGDDLTAAQARAEGLYGKGEKLAPAERRELLRRIRDREEAAPRNDGGVSARRVQAAKQSAYGSASSAEKAGQDPTMAQVYRGIYERMRTILHEGVRDASGRRGRRTHKVGDAYHGAAQKTLDALEAGNIAFKGSDPNKFQDALADIRDARRAIAADTSFAPKVRRNILSEFDKSEEALRAAAVNSYESFLRSNPVSRDARVFNAGREGADGAAREATVDPTMLDRLDEVFPDQTARDRFLRSVDNEFAAQGTEREILSGSQTQSRAAIDREIVDGEGSQVFRVVSNGIDDLVFRLVWPRLQNLGDRVVRRITKRVADRMAQQLTRRDFAALADELEAAYRGGRLPNLRNASPEAAEQFQQAADDAMRQGRRYSVEDGDDAARATLGDDVADDAPTAFEARRAERLEQRRAELDAGKKRPFADIDDTIAQARKSIEAGDRPPEAINSDAVGRQRFFQHYSPKEMAAVVDELDQALRDLPDNLASNAEKARLRDTVAELVRQRDKLMAMRPQRPPTAQNEGRLLPPPDRGGVGPGPRPDDPGPSPAPRPRPPGPGPNPGPGGRPQPSREVEELAEEITRAARALHKQVGDLSVGLRRKALVGLKAYQQDPTYFNASPAGRPSVRQNVESEVNRLIDQRQMFIKNHVMPVMVDILEALKAQAPNAPGLARTKAARRLGKTLDYFERLANTSGRHRVGELTEAQTRRLSVEPKVGRSGRLTMRRARAELDKLAPGAGLRFERLIDGRENIAGAAEGLNVILGPRGGLDTVRHEVVHLYKAMGVFRPGEWRALTRRAQQWAKGRGIEGRYPGASRADLEEEMVAEFLAKADLRQGSLFARIRQRMIDIANSIRKAFGAMPAEDAERIMKRFREGGYAERFREAAN